MPAPGEFDPALDRYPSRDPGPVPPSGSAAAAHPRAPPRTATRDARASLLQDGVLQPDGQPQGEHGARPGMVREERGIRAADDGDGSGTMGNRPRVRGEPRRPQDDDLLGPRGPRLENPAAKFHEALRWNGPRLPEPADDRRPRAAREGPEASRFPGHRGLRG